jgi:hypothetical protein
MREGKEIDDGQVRMGDREIRSWGSFALIWPNAANAPSVRRMHLLHLFFTCSASYHALLSEPAIQSCRQLLRRRDNSGNCGRRII